MVGGLGSRKGACFQLYAELGNGQKGVLLSLSNLPNRTFLGI